MMENDSYLLYTAGRSIVDGAGAEVAVHHHVPLRRFMFFVVAKNCVRCEILAVIVGYLLHPLSVPIKLPKPP